jgi:pimeloyl-ACP methyl ester carboxylesterase
MTYVSAGNLRLWTARAGDQADPPILLIAGAEGQSVHWPPAFVSRLVAGGLQVITYDHRDAGRSDLVDFDSSPYGAADLVSDALAVLDGLNLPSAHVVGTSMGGGIAQWLAAAHPSRVRTLTLMNTTPIGGAPEGLPAPDPAFLSAAAALTALPQHTTAQRIDVAVRAYDLFTANPNFDRPTARRMAAEAVSRSRSRTSGANHYRAAATHEDPPPLSAIEAPTLVIAAESDPIFPPPHAHALASSIPGARLERVPGLGHMMLALGQPEHLADLILAHKASTPARPGRP